MSDITRKLAIFGCLLFTSFCFWKAVPGLIGGSDASMLPSAQAALSPPVTPPRVVTTPIQEMRPGMRVVGRNPIRIQTEATIDPTPEGWRLVSVRMLKPDGTYFEAELLRPLSWISRHHAHPGAVIELNMPELHVVGAAEVLSISDCPPIDAGDGPIVLSTFKNIANNVLNIYVEGETEPIGVTAGHPIWSEDRQAFIHSDQLQPGERLRSAVGKTVRITSIEIRAGPEPVYNLEVAGEHVYSVTNAGLLVHNIGCEDLSTTIDVYSSNHLVSQFDTVNPGTPKGIDFEGIIWRYEIPERFDSTWTRHPWNIRSKHRYSGEGVGAVYGGLTEKTALYEVTQGAGITNVGERVAIQNNVSVKNILDLTNANVRNQLGVTLEQITTKGDYRSTHILSNFARENGFGGILAPSAQLKGGNNLIYFGDF